ncbi:MAG TPA: hypothetical protein VM911_08400, partial [Pyrinomonadaceae bacterium]|nr:hypothetical protein [Pyrinomonadaceae bacterium]
MARHKDALFHPVFLDPRFMATLNPYDETPPPVQKPTEAKSNETRSRNFDVQHIRLALNVDPAEKYIEGTATIHLKALRDRLDALEFDASELNVSEVRQGTRRLGFESFTDKLIVALSRPLRRGQSLTLRISYSARPRRGLHFVKPDESYTDKPLQVWSQGEAEDSHAWFPCTDSPNERQTTETIITVPERLMVLSNGTLLSEKRNAKRGQRTFHWRQDEPHP